jgi:signal transduction histidine kinase
MIPSAGETSVLIESDARRDRARERLYVLCQTGAWGVFLAIQVLLADAFAPREVGGDELVTIYASHVMVVAMGLLLTHYSRSLIGRWGWKQIGWLPLVPRVLGLAIVLSVLWSALGFGWIYGVVQMPWKAKYSLTLVLVTSVINGTIMFTGWYCVYFCYHLFDRYNRLQIEQLKLAAHVKEAELRALKSQVNPHFIFNSLNSLRALIDENPARAREAVTQLANLLRYSLQSAQAETVAFEDELRVVNDYLALEQVRHEERLRVRLDVDPATLGLAVPPLLLQTLVENAVKYGISTRPEGGEIAVIARCAGGRLHLRVINPGALPPAGAAPRGGATSTGLGLKNAADRLRMFFGDRATLQLRADGDTRVVAEVFIPAQLSRA